jgi:hypothetical protein
MCVCVDLPVCVCGPTIRSSLCRIPLDVPPLSFVARGISGFDADATPPYLLAAIKDFRRTGIRTMFHLAADKNLITDLLISLYQAGAYGRGYAMFVWAGDLLGGLDMLYTDGADRTITRAVRNQRQRSAAVALTGAVILDYVDAARELPDGVFRSIVSQYLAPDAAFSDEARNTGLLYDTIRLLGHGLSNAIRESLQSALPISSMEATALMNMLRNQSFRGFHGVFSYSYNEPTLDISVYNFWEDFVLVMKGHLQTKGPMISVMRNNPMVCSESGIAVSVSRERECWRFQGDPILWPGNTTDASFANSGAQCPGGLFVDPISKRCESCSAGSYTCAIDGSLLHAATSCKGCAPGFAQAHTEATSCELCPPGTFSPRNGSAQCTACTSGFFAGAGADSPRPEPFRMPRRVSLGLV